MPSFFSCSSIGVNGASIDDISSAVCGGSGIKQASLSLGVNEEEEDVECRRELGGIGGNLGIVSWVGVADIKAAM